MATTARQQYFADETSLSKEKREFSIADSVQQKIDSIETGAEVNVIEEVKVNGVPLVPDANKAVDIYVPGVVDNLYSLSTTDALSAKQGKVLYDFIQNIASRGRFLSNWDCATGLPTTDPTENPYPYMAGDYYTVSNVAAAGGTNYRPDGSSYISRQASTTVETDNVVVSDMYLYDGTNWLLLSNRQIAVDTSLSTTSTNPVENRVITNALSDKANVVDVLTKTNTTSYTPTTDYHPATKKYVDDNGMAFKPFPNTFDTTHTTQDFLDSIENENLPVGSAYLGQVALSDMPSGVTVQGDVEVYIYPQNIIYAVMKSTDVSPYEWIVNSQYNRGREPTDTDTTYTAGTNVQISAQNVISATDTTYTAGDNVSISGTVISATDTTYNAGTNITIGDDCTTESDMKGPCPKGWHIPLQSERSSIVSSFTTFGILNVSDFTQYLKLPLNGYIGGANWKSRVGKYGGYWGAEKVGNILGSCLKIYGPDIYPQNTISVDSIRTVHGYGIRSFRDSPVVPDSSWTTLYDGSSTAAGAGIFHNATEGLISISTDGTTWYTMADKNLGATTVWNSGDTLSESNCGGYFQWGNNYMFPFSGTITDSSNTQVDASGYGPGNYYTSSTWINDTTGGNNGWDTSDNRNLRGGTSQGTFQDCIHNVISAVDTTYSAGTGISIDANNEISNTGVISTNNTYDNIIYLSQSDYDNLQNKDANTLYCTPSADVLTFVDTSGYSSSWDGDTQHAPSRDAVYDKIDAMDTTISAKANSVDVLEKTNTTSYTPTADYHPATKLYTDTHGPAIPVYSYHGDFSTSISCDVAVGGTYRIVVTGYHGGTINRDITITVDNVQAASYTSTVIETFCYQTVVTATGGTGSTIVIGKSSSSTFTVYDVYIEKIDIQTGYITATVS